MLFFFFHFSRVILTIEFSYLRKYDDSEFTYLSGISCHDHIENRNNNPFNEMCLSFLNSFGNIAHNFSQSKIPFSIWFILRFLFHLQLEPWREIQQKKKRFHFMSADEVYLRRTNENYSFNMHDFHLTMTFGTFSSGHSAAIIQNRTLWLLCRTVLLERKRADMRRSDLKFKIHDVKVFQRMSLHFF